MSRRYTISQGAPDGPIHEMFGLTYANYAVFPRALLQSMPLDWQERFKVVIDEFWEHFGGCDLEAPTYAVQAKGYDGKFVVDPAPHYWRGRTMVTPEARKVTP